MTCEYEVSILTAFFNLNWTGGTKKHIAIVMKNKVALRFRQSTLYFLKSFKKVCRLAWQCILDTLK